MVSRGISEKQIADTPIAIFDTETTGLYPGGDRVIEIAIVRIEPGGEPIVVLDTLVNPGRPVAATEIHGITDGDVADAPSFAEVTPLIVGALSGSVFASYNVYFDSKFIREELGRAGVNSFPPHLCLMYMRPMLGLGGRCSLRDACDHSGVVHSKAHHAAADALAAAALWKQYLQVCRDSGIRTFGQLAAKKSYKFTQSFDDSLLAGASRLTSLTVKMKSRGAQSAAGPPAHARAVQSDRQPILAAYWDALTAALSDLTVTPHEVFYLRAKQSALSLRPEELRWLHARAFSGILADMCNDKAISTAEASSLAEVAMALRELGWSPGDVPADA